MPVTPPVATGLPSRPPGSILRKRQAFIAGDCSSAVTGDIMRIAFGDLKGRTVLEAGGQVVGTLDELIIATDPIALWGIRLRLKRETAKEIGASSGGFRGAVLDLPIEMVSAAGDAIILSVSLSRLREQTSGTKEGPEETAQATPAPDGRS
jgi:sporulation protein YlmC with PRC-barrel domain